MATLNKPMLNNWIHLLQFYFFIRNDKGDRSFTGLRILRFLKTIFRSRVSSCLKIFREKRERKKAPRNMKTVSEKSSLDSVFFEPSNRVDARVADLRR